jgi:hypothetical protein
MWQRFPYNPTAYDDDWEDQPKQGPFYQWGLGAIVPLFFLYHGIHAIVIRHASYGRPEQTLTLEGWNAIALGVAAVSVSLFLHCHYFWGNIYNQAWFAVLGKIIALIGFIAGMGVVMVRVGLLGIG